MASQNLPAQAKESKPRYWTRYGIMTADKVADDLLDRSWSRLRFLEGVLSVVHHDGDGFTMTDYSSLGLAAILEDIAIDVAEARSYYQGDDDMPGRTGDVVEPRVE